jgi:hypothetical protein
MLPIFQATPSSNTSSNPKEMAIRFRDYFTALKPSQILRYFPVAIEAHANIPNFQLNLNTFGRMYCGEKDEDNTYHACVVTCVISSMASVTAPTLIRLNPYLGYSHLPDIYDALESVRCGRVSALLSYLQSPIWDSDCNYSFELINVHALSQEFQSIEKVARRFESLGF